MVADMEFRLPFPNLKYLCAHRVVLCLVKLKVDMDYWVNGTHSGPMYQTTSLRECKQMIKKLNLPSALRYYVRDVVCKLFMQVSARVRPWKRNAGADLIFDARGNIDKRQITRRNLERCWPGLLYRKDFLVLSPLLEFAAWCARCHEMSPLFRIIQALQSMADIRLEGPLYVFNGAPVVVYRAVHQCGNPAAFNAISDWAGLYASVTVEKDVVIITWKSSFEAYHSVETFKTVLNLIQPAKKLAFIKEVSYTLSRSCDVEKMTFFLNAMDSETRVNFLLYLGQPKRDKYDLITYYFLSCFLVPPYDYFFIPAVKHVASGIDTGSYCQLFEELSYDIDLRGYVDMLLQFWQILPVTVKRDFRWDCSMKCSFQHVMKNIYEKNANVYQYIVKDVRTVASSKAELALRRLREKKNPGIYADDYYDREIEWDDNFSEEDWVDNSCDEDEDLFVESSSEDEDPFAESSNADENPFDENPNEDENFDEGNLFF